MKITYEEMWESIERIYADARQFPAFTAREVGYAIPEALKECAVRMIRDGRPTMLTNQRVLDEQNVIDGLRELRQNGFLKFENEE